MIQWVYTHEMWSQLLAIVNVGHQRFWRYFISLIFNRAITAKAEQVQKRTAFEGLLSTMTPAFYFFSNDLFSSIIFAIFCSSISILTVFSLILPSRHSICFLYSSIALSTCRFVFAWLPFESRSQNSIIQHPE